MTAAEILEKLKKEIDTAAEEFLANARGEHQADSALRYLSIYSGLLLAKSVIEKLEKQAELDKPKP